MNRKVFLLALTLLSASLAGAQTAFSEDFQNVTITGQVGQFPTGWTTYGDNHTNGGNFAMFGTSWCVSAVEQGNNAAASVSLTNEGGNVDRWMVTPAISVPSASYSLQFRAFSADLAGTERLRVMVSTTGVDKTDFTTLHDYVFDGSQEVSGGWNSISLPLADYAGQTIHIAFVNHGDGYFVFVDDIKVSAAAQNLHKVLLETFTSQHCGNCPEGEEALEGAYEGLENQVAWVSHHAGFQNDQYTINESLELEALYNTTTYAPALMIDRNMAFSEGNPGPVHYVGTSVMMHQMLSRAASMSDNIVIGITNIDYNATTRELRLRVDGSFIRNQTIEAPRLTVYLVEDSLIGYQSYAPNENSYRHDHVVRACLTNAWGDADAVGSTAAGATFSKTFAYTLPAGMRANKCYLVACVNNYGSDVAYGRQVFNTAKSGYITQDHGSPVTIDQVQAALSVKTYPNPAADLAYISAGTTLRSATVLSVDGKEAMRIASINADLLELDVSSLAEGLYVVRLMTDQGPATGRLMVMHR